MVGLAAPSPLTTTLWLGMLGCGDGVGLWGPPGLNFARYSEIINLNLINLVISREI